MEWEVVEMRCPYLEYIVVVVVVVHIAVDVVVAVAVEN
jgi:hypothetical protein